MRQLSPLFFLLLFINRVTAQVGINTVEPVTTLDINGAFSFRRGTDLLLKEGKNDNINLSETIYSNYNISGPDAFFSISGFEILPNSDGQILTILNTTSSSMTIIHNANSDPKNRIFCPNEKDLVLPNRFSSVTFQYNNQFQRWMIISISSINNTENIHSVSSVSETTISYDNHKNYGDISGMSIRFMALADQAFVSMTTSGQFRNSNSSGEVFLRVVDQDNQVIGGTAHTSRSVGENQISLSFSKLWTGLVPGTIYTLKIQGRINKIVGAGNPRYVIKPYERETDHLTLTVIQ